MAVVFDSCCGCIELRKGCLIIAYVMLVFTIIMILLSPVAIVYGYISMSSNSDSHNVSYTIGLFLVIVFSIVLIIGLLQLIYTIVLLIGLHQDKRSYVKAYLTFAMIFLALFIVGTVLNSTMFYFDIRSMFEKIVAFSISLYQYWIIRSYYIKMGENIKPTKGSNLT